MPEFGPKVPPNEQRKTPGALEKIVNDCITCPLRKGKPVNVRIVSACSGLAPTAIAPELYRQTQKGELVQREIAVKADIQDTSEAPILLYDRVDSELPDKESKPLPNCFLKKNPEISIPTGSVVERLLNDQV